MTNYEIVCFSLCLEYAVKATLFKFFEQTKNKSNVDLAGIIF